MKIGIENPLAEFKIQKGKFKKEKSKTKILLGVPKGKRRYHVNHSEMGGNFFQE